MWVKIITSTVNKQSGFYLITCEVSNDINSLTIKVGGTEQVFNKTGNVVDFKIPIKESVRVRTSVYHASELLFTLSTSQELCADIIESIQVHEFKPTKLQVSTEIIEISETVDTHLFTKPEDKKFGDLKIGSNITVNTEYDRGIRDGLILGQMI